MVFTLLGCGVGVLFGLARTKPAAKSCRLSNRNRYAASTPGSNGGSTGRFK
jgi:hypothetical protein